MVYRFYEKTLEKACQREENYCTFVIKLLILIKFMRCDQPITVTERIKGDSVPDTKSAEQSDENISSQESFKKGKEKVNSERQKVY